MKNFKENSIKDRHEKCFYKHKMSGLSLIEILVTVVILSVGLLGIAGMQAFGMRFNHDSYGRSQATLISNELIERMHANPDAVTNGEYVIALNALNGGANCTNANDPANPASAAPSCSGTVAGGQTCDRTQLANLDVFHMFCGQYLNPPNTLVGGAQNVLPFGNLTIGCIDNDLTDANPCTGDNNRVITVTWQDPDQKGVAANLQVQINARFL